MLQSDHSVLHIIINMLKLTLLDDKIGEKEGNCVATEDVVATENMLAVDREAASRDDSEDSLDNDEAGDVFKSRPALVPHVRLGQDRNEHGEGSVVVKDTKDEPDPPQYDQPVAVTEDHADRQDEVDNQDHLTHVQAVGLVGDVIQHHVRQGGGVGGDPVVGHRQAQGGGQEATQQEQSTDHSLQRLLGNFLCLIVDIDHGMISILRSSRLLKLDSSRLVRRSVILSQQSDHFIVRDLTSLSIGSHQTSSNLKHNTKQLPEHLLLPCANNNNITSEIYKYRNLVPCLSVSCPN